MIDLLGYHIKYQFVFVLGSSIVYRINQSLVSNGKIRHCISNFESFIFQSKAHVQTTTLLEKWDLVIFRYAISAAEVDQSFELALSSYQGRN